MGQIITVFKLLSLVQAGHLAFAVQPGGNVFPSSTSLPPSSQPLTSSKKPPLCPLPSLAEVGAHHLGPRQVPLHSLTVGLMILFL